MIFLIFNLLANILIIIGASIILLCAINFFRKNNILDLIHYAILANIYGVSTLLIGLGIKNYQIQNMLKILIIVILNLVISAFLNRIFNQNTCNDKTKFEDIKKCKVSF